MAARGGERFIKGPARWYQTGSMDAKGQTRMTQPPPATHRHRLVVSIINYRTGAMTIGCVQSVLEDLGDVDGHVVVVDNASGDGSADEIAGWIAAQPAGIPVSLVRSARNSGFSGGHNQGMAARPGDFYLILNSDAKLRPGALAALLAAADANPRAGLIAPRLEDEDTTPQISAFRLPGPASEMIRGAGSGPVTRLLARWDMPLGTEPEPDRIGWVSFACVLVRAELAEQIGPMDEGYFLYSEDADYCWQAARAGWSILFEPRARIVHFRGGSAPVKRLTAARKRLPAYYYASRTRLLYKMHGRLGLLAANLAWTLGRGLAWLRPLTGRAVDKGIAGQAGDIWINFLDPLGDARAPGDP